MCIDIDLYRYCSVKSQFSSTYVWPNPADAWISHTSGPYLGFFVCGGKLGFREISDQYSYKKQPSKIRHYVRKKTFSFPGGGNCPLRPPAMYGPVLVNILSLYRISILFVDLPKYLSFWQPYECVTGLSKVFWVVVSRYVCYSVCFSMFGKNSKVKFLIFFSWVVSFVLGSLWVVLRSSSVVWRSLWIVVGRCGIVVGRCGSLWIVVGRSGF